MADKPNNLGEVLFKSLGQGLDFVGSNLVPFLQQERNNRMQQIQMMMAQQQHALQMEQAQTDLATANLKLKTATEQAGKSLEQIKTEEAQAKAAADLAQTQSIFSNFLGAPMSGILGALPVGLGDIGQVVQGQLPVGSTLNTPMLDIKALQPDLAGQAQALGLVPSGLNQDGTVSYARPYENQSGGGRTITEGFGTNLATQFMRGSPVVDKQGKISYPNPKDMNNPAVLDSAASLNILGNFSGVPTHLPIGGQQVDYKALQAASEKRQRAIDTANSIFPRWTELSPKDQEEYLQFLENRK